MVFRYGRGGVLTNDDIIYCRVLGIIYYTAKYRNINQANERMNSKISFKILNGVADILAIYLIGLCIPLFLWWIAYLVKTYII